MTIYLLLALLMLAHAFSTIVSDLRDLGGSVEEPAHVDLLDVGEIVVFESEAEEVIGGGANAHSSSSASMRRHRENPQV